MNYNTHTYSKYTGYVFSTCVNNIRSQDWTHRKFFIPEGKWNVKNKCVWVCVWSWVYVYPNNTYETILKTELHKTSKLNSLKKFDFPSISTDSAIIMDRELYSGTSHKSWEEFLAHPKCQGQSVQVHWDSQMKPSPLASRDTSQVPSTQFICPSTVPSAPKTDLLHNNWFLNLVIGTIILLVLEGWHLSVFVGLSPSFYI